jgi:hypothetical protein
MLHAQCLRITPAMTEAEVLGVMGPPDSVRERPGEKRLSYDRYYWYSSGPVDIIFSTSEAVDAGRPSEEYRVLRTVCEDIW